MIFLAIDEMQSAERREQHDTGAGIGQREVSTPCTMRPAWSFLQSEREEAEARIERFHRQVQAGDE